MPQASDEGIRLGTAAEVDGRNRAEPSLEEPRCAGVVGVLRQSRIMDRLDPRVLRQPMVRLVTVLQGPARGLVRAMDEIAKQKEGGAPAPEPETPIS